MNRTARNLSVGLSAVLMMCASLATIQAELSFEPSWQLPEYDQVRTAMLKWIDQLPLDAPQRQALRETWPAAGPRNSDGAMLLDQSVETFAEVDPRVRKLVHACLAEHTGPSLPDIGWLRDEDLAPVVRNNVSLYYARWLAQRGLYDEAIESLEGLAPIDVFDPAGLLFYRTVAYQQLVMPEESRAALVQLQEHEDLLPRRYQQVAQLLSRDLSGLKDESLDHIARRMNDVRRRLEFGRAGDQVQMVEQSVVDSLDKLIKQAEDQQQQQQQGGGASGGQPSGQPMPDSQLPTMRSPMQVDQRDVGNKSGWGDLPAKEREQALQLIGREFPAHYRELIEQYFRELADESSTTPPEISAEK